MPVVKGDSLRVVCRANLWLYQSVAIYRGQPPNAIQSGELSESLPGINVTSMDNHSTNAVDEVGYEVQTTELPGKSLSYEISYSRSVSRTPGVVARIRIIIIIIIIVLYIYHALINGLRAHIIHINLSTIFYAHIEDSPTKAIYIRHYMDTHTHTRTRTHMHARMHFCNSYCALILAGAETL